MNRKAMMKNSSLIIASALLVVFLLMTVGPVLSGDWICYILPSLNEDRDLYCPDYMNWEEDIAAAFCNILPTPGISGCTCANDHCMGWIDNDVCRWEGEYSGIYVAKPVCRNLAGTMCEEVARTGIIEKVGRFLRTYDCFIPAGGCCDTNEECVTGKCGGFKIRCLFQDPNNPGVFIGGKKCLDANKGEPCRKDSDCAKGCRCVYYEDGIAKKCDKDHRSECKCDDKPGKVCEPSKYAGGSCKRDDDCAQGCECVNNVCTGEC
jgi:hypothetical protein